MRGNDHGPEDDHQDEPRSKKRRSADTSSMSTNNSVTQDTCETRTNGIIEYVLVKNFMCHDRLNFPFYPDINFIQGRNGSGKSAVLTAVVVGLGGASRLTNRGSSLKELVKYGKQIATIEISIKNCCKEPAFRHKDFGDSIIVERKIDASGGGGYRLLAKNRTVVSTKKEDLGRVLGFYNMQVDNPITVLNQDMSKSFLNSTDPRNLYKFFLKATQLQQMIEDYMNLDRALQSSSSIIQSRRESLPYLKKEVEEKRLQYEFCVTLREKRKKLSELRRELVWAVIIQKEKKEAEVKGKLEAQANIKDKGEVKIEKLKQKLEKLEESHRTYNEQFTKLSQETKAKSKEVQVANDAVIKTKNEMKDIQRQLRTIQRSVKEINNELALMKDAEERTNNNAQSQWSVRRAKWMAEVEEVKASQEQTKQDASTEQTHYNNLTNTLEIRRNEHSQVDFEEKALRRKIRALEEELRGLKGQQGNQFTVFGHWVPRLLKEIDIAHSKGAFSKKPVGPLGAFVKMRDSEWGHVAEAVLGGRISAFCVDNDSDEKVLQKIMNGINLGRQPQVIVTKFREKVHDVSRFEVQSDQYPSLWSMLIINSTVVANIIIDMMKVESILLIPTAEEAGQILKDRTKVPANCKVAYTLNRDMYYPDPNYRLYSGRGKQPARFLQVSIEQLVRKMESELVNSRTEMNMVKQNLMESVKEMRKIEDEVKASNRKLKAYMRTLDQLRFKLAELQNQEEHPPLDMLQCEEDIKQQEARLAREQETQATYEDQLAAAQKRFAEASDECEKLRKVVENIFQETKSINEKVNQSESQKKSLTSSFNSLKKDLQEILKNELELEKMLKDASEDLSKELEAAEKFQPRIDKNRSVNEVKQLYDGLETRLNKEQAQSGDPVIIAERYKETRMRHERFSAEIDLHSKLIKDIRNSLDARQEQYKHFRKMISVYVKANFTVHLSNRKLKGSLQFDFEKETLVLNVTQMNNNYKGSTKDTIRSEKQTKKLGASSNTPRLTMMSGGERSFSTVSFLISLWNVIKSPVRILDEFDVFMDVVARRRAMNMMIQAAMPGTQYIYLSPLDTNFGEQQLKKITVFRMPDPQRNEKSSSQSNSQ
ncbi:hypothetical protein Pcinc_020986 [Petrolisthes cinctipes]|uniref:Rad50/SbcC-type AAA domain-containing protein n=1 Tax=Petrolisthes cinctipes TaxID=88211 RepID=A0AAE1FGQ5_PETCI|nr:hypothetical protein Pcinc_020986 [Petrolisthes cinctipes]